MFGVVPMLFPMYAKEQQEHYSQLLIVFSFTLEMDIWNMRLCLCKRVGINAAKSYQTSFTVFVKIKLIWIKIYGRSKEKMHMITFGKPTITTDSTTTQRWNESIRHYIRTKADQHPALLDSSACFLAAPWPECDGWAPSVWFSHPLPSTSHTPNFSLLSSPLLQ